MNNNGIIKSKELEKNEKLVTDWNQVAGKRLYKDDDVWLEPQDKMEFGDEEGEEEKEHSTLMRQHE